MSTLPMTLTTAGERVIDLTRPTPEDIAVADIAHALSHICRFGGHTRRFYSVAQHCTGVCDLLRPYGPRVQRLGLLHDAAEAYLGDVVTPLKRHLAAYAVFEDKIERAIMERFNVLEDWLTPEYHEAIKWADTMALHWEHRDLFPKSAEWELPEECAMLAPLDPLSPDPAYHHYLVYFEQFFPASAVDALLAHDRRPGA